MSEFDLPLRLAKFSQPRGIGRGCAMNVISWELGEKVISDQPRGIDGFLGSLVRQINDLYCSHLVDGLLCPPCSQKVLYLAHLLVGLKITNVNDLEWMLSGYEWSYSNGGESSRGSFSGCGVVIPQLTSALEWNKEHAYQIVLDIIQRVRNKQGLSPDPTVSPETTQRALAEMRKS